MRYWEQKGQTRVESSKYGTLSAWLRLDTMPLLGTLKIQLFWEYTIFLQKQKLCLKDYPLLTQNNDLGYSRKAIKIPDHIISGKI